MTHGRITIITGSPGTGKSTVADKAAMESDMEKSVCIRTDDFFHYLKKGAIPPHLPESNAQNGVVIEAFLETAKRFVKGGYDVYVDGIVGPWFLEPWLGAAREGYDVHYIVLRASREITLRRAVERSKLDLKTNTELVEVMWEQFCDLGKYEAKVDCFVNLWYNISKVRIVRMVNVYCFVDCFAPNNIVKGCASVAINDM